jgi:hypothetical protein
LKFEPDQDPFGTADVAEPVELDGGIEVFHDDADVVHPFDRHGFSGT